MATLIAVSQVRSALGDSADEPAWTDAELAVRLDQHGGLIATTIEECFLELQAEAAGRFTYTIGSSSQSLSDIFAQLDRLVIRWGERAAVERRQAEQGSADAAPPVAVPVEVWF